MFRKKYTLLRSQKKEVYEILLDSGLEPGEFSWSKEEIAEALIVSRLNHREGQFYFQFSSYELNAWCVMCPGVFRSMDTGYPKNWNEQLIIFRSWAQSLRRELETSDPWEEMAKYKLAVDGQLPDGVVNEPISAVEADGIGQALVRLADEIIREFSLSGGRAATVRGKLGYLAEAAERQRSRDWLYSVLGVCTTIAAILSLSERDAKKLWRLFEGELRQFIQLVGPEIKSVESPAARRIRADAPIDHKVDAAERG